MTEEKKPTSLGAELNNNKYIPKDASGMPQIPPEIKKELEKQKADLDKVKKFILKKYPFTISIGLLPPQSIPKIEEEEDIPENEKKDKRTHVLVLIPEDQFKNIPKIKKEILDYTKDIKPKLWLHIITPIDIWNFYMDARYDLTNAIAMSLPLYDKGLLGALRVAEVHKNLVIRKFEKYVSSYVIAGSLVRGTASKTSDVDVFIIIDDTDVKRMPRLELREKLRGIIYNYIAEAAMISGVENKLEPQIYLLTDFWEAVKDAHPVMFTFIRDGIPLYDRGTFIPWKLLLKMGKIKPSQESIDMFMTSGEKAIQVVNRRLMDVMIDIYYSVLNPSQALLMLYGLPTPTHKETPKVFEETFYTKEKLIEKKYVDTLTKVVRLFKEYEHGTLKEIKGSEIESLIKEAQDFLTRIKKLREQIEKVSLKNTINDFENEVFKLLESIFGKKSKEELSKLFDKELIKTAKMPPKMLTILKDIQKASNEFKKGKVNKNDIENARKDAAILINHLIEYAQRKDMAIYEKTKMTISYDSDKKRAELIITNSGVFINIDNSLKKITTKIQDCDIKELENALANQKNQKQVTISHNILEVLKKELGDFQIII